ncbi:MULTISPECIES: DUF3795 domain-containing protein [unclassified Butyrivibrio]|uniref:DUF3795 domain-containing protein n=1 Tax=unclassified Butyrivibrio TaxID=2639466 RepID=UPI0003B3C7EE|nr:MULTISPECIES: DUF3795 domain-containing protein [unclassified Butyrivibrio]
MDIIYKGERLKYIDDYYGDQVLWITRPEQIGMEHMKFVGGYPNEYCIYISELSTEERAEIQRQLLGQLSYCGVDCSACPDFLNKKCPSCRHTEWKSGDECMPVKCCNEKGFDSCASCDGFPCDEMAAFYKESDSHQYAYKIMSILRRMH